MAYPDLDLVTHGYGDAFTPDEIKRNVDVFSLEPGWDEMVEETGATVALVRPDSAFAYALENQLGWEIVEREGDAIALYRAPG